MPHALICGMSESGKSTLGKKIGSRWRLDGQEVVALNPTGEPGYDRHDEYGHAAAEWATHDADAFGREVYRRLKDGRKKPLFAIVDEGHEFFTRSEAPYLWMGTRGRHNGLSLLIITQEPAQMNPAVRGQCKTIYLFSCAERVAKFVADDYGDPALCKANELAAGKFLSKTRAKPGLDRGAVF